MADYTGLNLGGGNYLNDYLNSLNGAAPSGGTLASLNTQLSTKPYQMPGIQMNGTYGEAPKSGWNGGAPNYAPDGAGTYLPATGSGATAPIGAPGNGTYGEAPAVRDTTGVLSTQMTPMTGTGTGFDSDWYNAAFNNPAGQVAPTVTPPAATTPDWLAGYTGNNVGGVGSMTATDVLNNTYGPGSAYAKNYGPAGLNSGANTLTGAGSMTPADVMLKTYGGSGPLVTKPVVQNALSGPAPLVGDAAKLNPADAWKYFSNQGTGR